ncbi:MAG: biotin/lipoyl-containing protein, partial [Myxococcota bacterium]
MSTFDFKLPDIGEGVMEGEIVQWLVKPGDKVGEDEPVAEVMTDKATVTITSPHAGEILELGGAEGDIIAVHTTLVVLEVDGAVARPGARESSRGELGPPPAGSLERPATGAGEDPVVAPSAPPAPREGQAHVGGKEILRDVSPPASGPVPQEREGVTTGGLAPASPTIVNEKPLATPATRKLARDLGVDLRTVQPTGAKGRSVAEDV